VHTIADPSEPRRQWRSRFVAIAWVLSTVALAVCTSVLTYATAVEVHRLTRTLPARPPEVVSDVVVRNAPDTKGRRASFRILLFSDEFRWRLNSYNTLESTPTQPDFTKEMRAVLNDAEEIICIGASSEEIPAGVSFEKGRTEEEKRGARGAARPPHRVGGAPRGAPNASPSGCAARCHAPSRCGRSTWAITCRLAAPATRPSSGAS
jgi:hypothetical protein